MKRILRNTLLATAVILMASGCGSTPAVTPIPNVSLASTDASEQSQVKASAVILPARESRLSFVISGMVEEVSVKEGDQVQPGQALIKLNSTDQEYRIVAAEAALKAAESEAEIQRQPRKRFNFDSFNFEYLNVAGELIEQAESRAEQKRWAVEAAKALLAQATLEAPYAGTIVEVHIAPGEYVQPAQVVIVLATLDDLKAETTDLSELSVAAVKTGQPATVYIEALDNEFAGKVTSISPIADTVGGDVVFDVTIRLDVKPKVLLWGMSADVTIDVQ